MQILLNGESTSIKQDITASELLEQLGLSEKRLALEINLNIIPRSEFDHYVIQANDRVEVVQAIGGG